MGQQGNQRKDNQAIPSTPHRSGQEGQEQKQDTSTQKGGQQQRTERQGGTREDENENRNKGKQSPRSGNMGE